LEALVVIRIEDNGGVPLNDAKRRVDLAKANDNGGLWWVCLSRLTPGRLEHRFKEGSVASCLYQSAGGVLGSPAMKHSNNRQYLYLQLSRRDEFIDIALSDLGIEPIAVIDPRKITNP